MDWIGFGRHVPPGCAWDGLALVGPEERAEEKAVAPTGFDEWVWGTETAHMMAAAREEEAPWRCLLATAMDYYARPHDADASVLVVKQHDRGRPLAGLTAFHLDKPILGVVSAGERISALTAYALTTLACGPEGVAVARETLFDHGVLGDAAAVCPLGTSGLVVALERGVVHLDADLGHCGSWAVSGVLDAAPWRSEHTLLLRTEAGGALADVRSPALLGLRLGLPNADALCSLFGDVLVVSASGGEAAVFDVRWPAVPRAVYSIPEAVGPGRLRGLLGRADGYAYAVTSDPHALIAIDAGFAARRLLSVDGLAITGVSSNLALLGDSTIVPLSAEREVRWPAASRDAGFAIADYTLRLKDAKPVRRVPAAPMPALRRPTSVARALSRHWP